MREKGACKTEKKKQSGVENVLTKRKMKGPLSFTTNRDKKFFFEAFQAFRLFFFCSRTSIRYVVHARMALASSVSGAETNKSARANRRST